MNKLPIYVKIYDQFKEMIKEGVFKEGDKLPSKRKLADSFKVSPLTIEAAYAQLIAEGYVYALEKKGYFVDKQIELLKPKIEEKKNEIIKKEKIKYPYEFKTNVVDTSLFPHATWAKLSREVLSEQRYEMLNEVEPKGLSLLREEIKRYLELYRGIHVHIEQIIVGSGSTTLINMLVEILGRKKHYAVEDPGYDRIYQVLKGNDVKISLVPLDEYGLSVKDLYLKKADIVHITPSHQFPMGIVMPIQRRSELLNWATETKGYIIEDDYDSEFRFIGKPIPALFSLDQNDRIIYMNTFTKTLAPSFRIGYLVLPKHLIDTYESMSSYHGCTVPNFEQYILYQFMHKGYFERHINRMRNHYRQKIEIIADQIKDYPSLKMSGHESGLHFIIEVQKKLDSLVLLNQLNESGILIRDIQFYSKQIRNDFYPLLVTGYSGIPMEDTRNCFKKLFDELL
jgi:GntR family transcriptional regulator / MocR family aminotransferase